MSTPDNQVKPRERGQFVLWIILSILILIALSVVIGLESILVVNPADRSSIPNSYQWFVGLTSFLVGAVLLIRAPSTWETKRVRDLRDFGPNLWIQASLALGLCGLAYVFHIAGILPNATTKWGLFILLILLEFSSGILTFGAVLLLLLVVEELFKNKIDQIHVLLREPEYQQYDFSGLLLGRLKKDADLNIPAQGIDVLSKNWDAENGKLTLVIGWEKETNNSSAEGKNAPKSKNGNEPKILHTFRYEIVTDSRGKILTITTSEREAKSK